MPDPSKLRDSTQIVLPQAAVDGLETRLDEEFTVSVVEETEEHYRIIGSPVEIKGVSEFLTKHGVSLP